MLEPYAGKLARTVLRGGSGGNAALLPDPQDTEGALELRVHKVVQFASGGSHVTKYEADVEFVAGGSGVQVLGSEPRDALRGCYQMAVESIRHGAEQVLNPLGMGAVPHSPDRLASGRFQAPQVRTVYGRRVEATGRAMAGQTTCYRRCTA
jgi:hypothetical protein